MKGEKVFCKFLYSVNVRIYFEAVAIFCVHIAAYAPCIASFEDVCLKSGDKNKNLMQSMELFLLTLGSISPTFSSHDCIFSECAQRTGQVIIPVKCIGPGDDSCAKCIAPGNNHAKCIAPGNNNCAKCIAPGNNTTTNVLICMQLQQ